MSRISFDEFRDALPFIGREVMPPRIPATCHRHGSPSGPWPFVDLDSEIDEDELNNLSPATTPCPHTPPDLCKDCWSHYPQSLYPNWTKRQQHKGRIGRLIERSQPGPCKIYRIDVLESGEFGRATEFFVERRNREQFWDTITQQRRPNDTRVRAIFVENLSGPVLQMLGTKYNIEPFFFSSSLGWIPSRYQEEVRQGEGDHITITLRFIRTVKNPSTVPPSPSSRFTASTTTIRPAIPDQAIDTQAPLTLSSTDRLVVSDLLAFHMVRSRTNGCTLISYHPTAEHRTTTAKALHKRLRSTGRSVYWNGIFTTTKDPTFVLLSILWYALYAWDEALEVLYTHICTLEPRVMNTNDMHLTTELHIVRAHLLHYEALLVDFAKAVAFVLDTPFPALDNPLAYTPEERLASMKLMKKECHHLLGEIDRLEMSRRMQDLRLKNVMDLGFSIVNIEDSRQMQKLTESAAHDSAAMKQISYLTMLFLPASFVASVFGMNVSEINPDGPTHLGVYLAVAIPMTALTVWIMVAIQFKSAAAAANFYAPVNGWNIGKRFGRQSSYGSDGKHSALPKETRWSFGKQLLWPLVVLKGLFWTKRETMSSSSKPTLKLRSHGGGI